MIGLLCPSCTHFQFGERATCAAFPDGIPEAILTGRVSHRKPHRGDRGIQFEPFELDAAGVELHPSGT